MNREGYEAWGDHRFRGRFHADIRDGMAAKGFFPDTATPRSRQITNELRFVKELRPGTKVFLSAVWEPNMHMHRWRWLSWLGQGQWVDTWEAAFVLGELAQWNLDQEPDSAAAGYPMRDRFKKEFTG